MASPHDLRPRTARNASERSKSLAFHDEAPPFLVATRASGQDARRLLRSVRMPGARRPAPSSGRVNPSGHSAAGGRSARSPAHPPEPALRLVAATLRRRGHERERPSRARAAARAVPPTTRPARSGPRRAPASGTPDRGRCLRRSEPRWGGQRRRYRRRGGRQALRQRGRHGPGQSPVGSSPRAFPPRSSPARPCPRRRMREIKSATLIGFVGARRTNPVACRPGSLCHEFSLPACYGPPAGQGGRSKVIPFGANCRCEGLRLDPVDLPRLSVPRVTVLAQTFAYTQADLAL